MGPCETCNGSGAEAGAKPTTCPTCRGHGKVRAQQGFFTIERTCPNCHGQGQVIEKPCRACRGEGRVRRERNLNVNIPAGVEDGTRIRLAGEGEAGLRGSPTGDLYIFVGVRQHRFFQRDGKDLHCQVPITMAAAALGGTVEIPTIDGTRAKLSIAAGTQSGHQLRVKGKGMSVLRQQGRGDLFVTVMVETPVNLTARQKELLREFEKEAGNNNPQSSGFFQRVKEFWSDLRD